MIIATYESKHPELPDSRRWLAQIEKIKGRMYVCFHGATEEEARTKAQDFWDKMPKKEPAADRPEEVVSSEPVPVIDAAPEEPKRRRSMDDLV